MKNRAIIFILFTALIFPKQDKECNIFLDNHNSDEIEKLISKVKVASQEEGNIEVLHDYFEGDTSSQIINKMDMISNCFKISGDSLNQYLSKVYLSRFHRRDGDFVAAKKEIDQIDKWAWDIKGTAIEDHAKFKEIDQYISSIKGEFYDAITNNSTDFSTLTIRIAPSMKGHRKIDEGSLVNYPWGEDIIMRILLPDNGDNIFEDPIKKKRFVYLKNNINSITFDHDPGDGSFVMQINYLPLLPGSDDFYTFLIKDISNGVLQRYTANFSQYNKGQHILNISFHENWRIKFSAAEDKIKVWLPISNEYEVRVENKYGNQEQEVLGNYPAKNGEYYNIYRLESMQDKDSEYDYKFIYQDLATENTSFMSKWGWRCIIMSLSAGAIVYQMGN